MLNFFDEAINYMYVCGMFRVTLQLASSAAGFPMASECKDKTRLVRIPSASRSWGASGIPVVPVPFAWGAFEENRHWAVEHLDGKAMLYNLRS